ncbi:hypothetical protein ACFGVS_29630 [Mucilaginibacter sp. AW1-7]|jgi:hypothetical protein|uniref:hypothetical protein n=1 Tax=Mucilaginibacter sp. AW1-7 TaxID=3349874 RepID=UPI003F7344FD
MKKWPIIIVCFSCLFIGSIWYAEFKYKLESLDWLLTKLAGMTLISVALIFVIVTNKESTGSKILRICNLLFWMIFMGYKDISKYNNNVHLNKFGLVFNDTRRRLGVPEIPIDWNVKYKWNRFVEWQAKDTTIGHQSKEIYIDSVYNVDFEDDRYKLKSIDSVSRSISITSRYARGKAKDSIFYNFNPGDSTRLISRQQADSVFAAEKIKKDYQR